MAAHPGQRGVPAALPLAIELSCPKLAPWPARRLQHGARARRLLPGVLLVLDGPAVLRWHHESVLDCRPCRLHFVGKNDPDGPLAWPGRSEEGRVGKGGRSRWC